MRHRFTLTHTPPSGPPVSVEIGEPGGWATSSLKLKRDKRFHSLIESYEGGLDGGVDYVGFVDDIPGGVDFIRDVENNYGFNAKISQLIEFSHNNVTYDTLFEGLLKMTTIKEMDDNTIRCGVIRDDFWSKFINRFDTPVDVTSTVDLDGNAVDAVDPVTVNLTSQKLRQIYRAKHEDAINVQYDIPDNQFGQIDFYQEEQSEIREKRSLVRTYNPARPGELFLVEYGGDYAIDIRIVTAIGGIGTYSGTDVNLQVRLQKNDDAAIVLTQTGVSLGIEGYTRHDYNNTLSLVKGDRIHIYFYNNNATGSSYLFNWMPNILFTDSYCNIIADTVYPETECEGFFLHDVASAICARIGLGSDKFYSDIMGSTATKARAYGSDGAFAPFVLLKGIHIRGYTLTDNVNDPTSRYTLSEKPFQISFKEFWEIVDPIFNLSLMYDNVSATQVIRVEGRAYQYDDSSTSINFDYVQINGREYDNEKIFKKVTIGYKDWQSENSSGIDDPQTKHIYATLLGDGVEAIIESKGIAAGLAIETTRRMKREKSSDYKFDDNFFIVHVDIENPESPESYNPKLDEDFSSMSNLLNKETRYNNVITPKRNMLRHLNNFLGCLQSYLETPIKFSDGEGNFNFISNYNCMVGEQDLAVVCNEIAESDDIELDSSGYAALIDYLHLPMLYNISIPMPWEDYQAVVAQRKKAIGISQTDTGHTKFFIEDMDYNHIEGEATFIGWPKTFMPIQQLSNEPEMACS